MKKRFLQKGKTFYTTLGLLVVFSYTPILIALAFTFQTLSHSHAALNAVLTTVQETQMSYSQDANPGRNHMDQLAALRENPFLGDVGTKTSLEFNADIQRAEEVLLSVTPAHSSRGLITTYLYFPNSNYLIDSSNLGHNAAGTANPIIFSGLDSKQSDLPCAFMYGPDSADGETHTFYTATVFPGVIFIFDIYFPEYPGDNRADVALSEEFTASLTDVELCYYDSYGNVRATSGTPNLIHLYDYHSIGPDENHSFSFTHNGHHYLCYYVFNEYNMTKYALFCRDEIAEEQHRTSTILWISAGILSVAFLTCAILYTRRTYKPIASLITRVDKNDGNSPPMLRDEFEVLNQAIDSFDDRLNKRDLLLSKVYLLRLLRGQTTHSLEDYRDNWFSDDENFRFAVAAIHMDEFQGGDYYEEAHFEQAVVGFLRSENWDVRTATDNDFVFVVCRLPHIVRDINLLHTFQRLQEHLKDFYISVYISDIHTSARELRRCYNEAIAISEYYIANEKICIVANMASAPQAMHTKGISTPNFGQLRKLSDCITTLSADDAVSTLDELTFQFVQADGNPLSTESMMYNLLVDTIALAFYDIEVPGEVSKAQIQQHINQIRGATGIGQLRQTLLDALTALTKRSDGQEYYLQRFEKVRDYILENYSDPNLDSTTIAECYNMSPSTITRLFKKYNQTGFLEFVHQTRVAKATELLQTTDLPIAEISTLVGYTNAATMNRAFKAHAKSTPSMIRKRMQD